MSKMALVGYVWDQCREAAALDGERASVELCSAAPVILSLLLEHLKGGRCVQVNAEAMMRTIGELAARPESDEPVAPV